MGTYVTSSGFQKKTLAEIKTELETEFQSIFGNDIDLESDGAFGQLIGILADRDADLWDALQEIYTARNPQEATGTSLDNIVAENSITRLPATATTVDNVILYGDDGTLVVSGKLAKQLDSLIEYSLDANVTIQKTTAVSGTISISTVSDLTLYTVTINAVPYTYTSDASATALEIMTGLKADIDAGSWTGNVSINTTDETMTLSDTVAFSFTVDANQTIEEVGSYGDFTATTTRYNPLPANSLTEIVTSVSGWNRVSNPSAGISGRALETDAELRLRREQSLNGIGNATEEAIRSKLLNDVNGVTSVNVYSNRTDTTDIDDRPPHSFEAVVVGGDDLEIAEKIWDIQPAGIQSTGNINADGSTNPTIPGEGIDIIDSQGYTQNIKFSRPEDIFIWVRVKRDLYSEEDYPVDGDNLIKEAIVNWSLEDSNIRVGKDVIRQRLSVPVYTIPGIEDILIELDSSIVESPYTPTYAEQNIEIDGRQVAVFSTGRIVVTNLT